MARFTKLLAALLMATTSAMDCSVASCEEKTSLVQISRKLQEGRERGECPTECNELPGSFDPCTTVPKCYQCPKCMTQWKIREAPPIQTCKADAVNGRKIIIVRHTIMDMTKTEETEVGHMGIHRRTQADGYDYADKIGKGLATYVAEGSTPSVISLPETSIYHQVKGASANSSSVKSGSWKWMGKGEMQVGESTILYSKGFNSIAKDLGIRKLQCKFGILDHSTAAAEERLRALDPDHIDTGRCGGMIAEELDAMLIDLLQSSKFPTTGDVVVVGSREWILHFLDIATGGTEANGDYFALKKKSADDEPSSMTGALKAFGNELDDDHMFAGNAFVFDCPAKADKWSISVVQLKELGEAYVAGAEGADMKKSEEQMEPLD